jgi:hypothetical protein
MVIDGVKYLWTERGTLARAAAGRRQQSENKISQ